MFDPRAAGLTAAEVSVAPEVICGGKTATIVGPEAGETLRPAPGNDVIAALGGDDTIQLTAGDATGRGTDAICLGEGKDILKGVHSDMLTVYGGNGEDTVNIGIGKILTVHGEDGNDDLYALGGPKAKVKVSLYGAVGNDTIKADLGGIPGWGGGGDDTLAPGKLSWSALTFHGGVGQGHPDRRELRRSPLRRRRKRPHLPRLAKCPPSAAKETRLARTPVREARVDAHQTSVDALPRVRAVTGVLAGNGPRTRKAGKLRPKGLSPRRGIDITCDLCGDGRRRAERCHRDQSSLLRRAGRACAGPARLSLLPLWPRGRWWLRAGRALVRCRLRLRE